MKSDRRRTRRGGKRRRNRKTKRVRRTGRGVQRRTRYKRGGGCGKDRGCLPAHWLAKESQCSEMRGSWEPTIDCNLAAYPESPIAGGEQSLATGNDLAGRKWYYCRKNGNTCSGVSETMKQRLPVNMKAAIDNQAAVAKARGQTAPTAPLIQYVGAPRR